MNGVWHSTASKTPSTDLRNTHGGRDMRPSTTPNHKSHPIVTNLDSHIICSDFQLTEDKPLMASSFWPDRRPQTSHLLSHSGFTYGPPRTPTARHQSAAPHGGQACGNYPPARKAQACREPSASVENDPDPVSTPIPSLLQISPSRHSS